MLFCLRGGYILYIILKRVHTFLVFWFCIFFLQKSANGTIEQKKPTWLVLIIISSPDKGERCEKGSRCFDCKTNCCSIFFQKKYKMNFGTFHFSFFFWEREKKVLLFNSSPRLQVVDEPKQQHLLSWRWYCQRRQRSTVRWKLWIQE